MVSSGQTLSALFLRAETHPQVPEVVANVHCIPLIHEDGQHRLRRARIRDDLSRKVYLRRIFHRVLCCLDPLLPLEEEHEAVDWSACMRPVSVDLGSRQSHRQRGKHLKGTVSGCSAHSLWELMVFRHCMTTMRSHQRSAQALRFFAFDYASAQGYCCQQLCCI